MGHNNTYIDAFIQDGKSDVISLTNLYDSVLVGSTANPDHIFRTAFGDFFLRYHDELEGIVKYFQCPEAMFYKPKMVSAELYGTTELWLALLRVNNMRNITEFHYPLIKIYDPTALKEYINIFFKREGKLT